jgi:hypothetical protein
VLDVTAVCAIKCWAEQHTYDIELHQRRPHEALHFAEAVVAGAQCALSAAAAAAAPLTQWHSSCFTAAADVQAQQQQQSAHAAAAVLQQGDDALNDSVASSTTGDDADDDAAEVSSASASGLAEEHWLYGGLDRLTSQLRNLVHLWQQHGLCFSLREFERLPCEAVIFRVLDRVQVSVYSTLLLLLIVRLPQVACTDQCSAMLIPCSMCCIATLCFTLCSVYSERVSATTAVHKCYSLLLRQ